MSADTKNANLNILIVNNQMNEHEAARQLTEILNSMGVPNTTLNSRDTIDLETLATFNGIILSGSPRDLTLPILMEELKLNIQVLLEASIPILGICGGLQLMALCFGSRMGKWKTDNIGMRKIKVLEPDSPLLLGIPEGFEGYEYHEEYVAEPPPDFELIATSIPQEGKHFCRVQAIQNLKRSFFGTQFHPENSGDLGKQIFQNFFNVCLDQ